MIITEKRSKFFSEVLCSEEITLISGSVSVLITFLFEKGILSP